MCRAAWLRHWYLHIGASGAALLSMCHSTFTAGHQTVPLERCNPSQGQPHMQQASIGWRDGASRSFNPAAHRACFERFIYMSKSNHIDREVHVGSKRKAVLSGSASISWLGCAWTERASVWEDVEATR